MKKFFFYFLFILTIYAVNAQNTGKWETSLDYQGTPINIAFYVPLDYNSSTNYPLIFALHPSSESYTEYRDLMTDAAIQLHAILACPQIIPGSNLQSVISGAASFVRSQYSIDSKKSIMTGFNESADYAITFGLEDKNHYMGVIANASNYGASSFDQYMWMMVSGFSFGFIIGDADASYNSVLELMNSIEEFDGFVFKNVKEGIDKNTVQYWQADGFITDFTKMFTDMINSDVQFSVSATQIEYPGTKVNSSSDKTVEVKSLETTNKITFTTKIINDDDNVFTIVEPQNDVELNPDENLTVKVKFSPKAAKSYSAKLSVMPNGLEAKSKIVNLTGAAYLASPKLSTGITKLEFDTVFTNTFKKNEVLMLNEGNDDLIISNIIINSNTDNAFTFQELSYPFTILPNNDIYLDLKFTPSQAIDYNADLVITSNSSVNPELHIALKGFGKIDAGVGDELSGDLSIIVSPNPITNSSIISVTTYFEAVLIDRAILTDINGNVLEVLKPMIKSNNEASFTINSYEYSSGTYYLTMKGNKIDKTVPVVIIK